MPYDLLSATEEKTVHDIVYSNSKNEVPGYAMERTIMHCENRVSLIYQHFFYMCIASKGINYLTWCRSFEAAIKININFLSVEKFSRVLNPTHTPKCLFIAVMHLDNYEEVFGVTLTSNTSYQIIVVKPCTI